jgi:YbbR domain-containing protein
MVNLSVDYNLNIDLPIQLGTVPSDKALANDLPEKASVSITAEGWKLINLYSNPPSINVDVTNESVNLREQVQQQMNTFGVEFQTVQPLILNVQLEDRISKKVPVESKVNVSFKDQYDFLESPEVQPDSITVNGAVSLVQNIEFWPTDSVHINNVSKNLSRAISLEPPGELISLSQDQVIYNASVTQYTEGEVKVNIYTRNLPQDRVISYSPVSLSVKYDVPIDEYAQVQDKNPFEAYVNYSQILQDSTGFVTPQIEQMGNNYHIKLRSFQPRRVAYFIVLGQQ